MGVAIVNSRVVVRVEDLLGAAFDLKGHVLVLLEADGVEQVLGRRLV